MSQVTEAVRVEHGMIIKPAYASSVMRLRFGMKFNKIKKVAYLANSDRSLVVRQLFAKKMLALLDEGFIILNLDETFLNQGDLRYRKWQMKNEENSMRERSIDPLLKVFAAVSSEGDVYMAVSQRNTDSETFCLFMQKLIAKLQKERPDFRENTIIQFDSADYHRSEITRNFLANNKIKMVTGGVYGYKLAPCELFFAGIKSVNLNPNYQATGKR